MAKWEIVRFKNILTESKIESSKPSIKKRIRVLLNTKGVIKRPVKNETKGATKYFRRTKGQFIYGKQNIHKGAFGIVPNELDGFESTSDLPAFDIADKCLPLWIEYFLKQGNFYLTLVDIARGVATKRVQPKEFFELKIPLPDVDEQKKFVAHFKNVERKDKELKVELTNQQTLLKKLRQQILQEAIEGKLTAEWRKLNPDIEPASKLLARIQEETAQLIKDKKIKKQKPLPPIDEKEKPFALPEGWAWCRIGNLGETKVGATPSKANPEYWDGNVSWVSSGEVANNYINTTKLKITNKGVKESSAKVNPKGSVLVAMIGQGKTRGQTAILTIEAATNQNVCAIRLAKEVTNLRQSRRLEKCEPLKAGKLLAASKAAYGYRAWLNKSNCSRRRSSFS